MKLVTPEAAQHLPGSILFTYVLLPIICVFVINICIYCDFIVITVSEHSQLLHFRSQLLPKMQQTSHLMGIFC